MIAEQKLLQQVLLIWDLMWIWVHYFKHQKKLQNKL